MFGQEEGVPQVRCVMLGEAVMPPLGRKGLILLPGAMHPDLVMPEHHHKAPRPPLCDIWILVSSRVGTKLWHSGLTLQ